MERHGLGHEPADAVQHTRLVDRPKKKKVEECVGARNSACWLGQIDFELWCPGYMYD